MIDQLIFILKCLILGIIEGVTEFLPISSTGHLIIFQHFLNMPDDDPFVWMFMIVIQLGAILAILVLFWPTLWDKIRSFFRWEKQGRHFVLNIIIACIPAAVLGFAFDKKIEQYLSGVPTVMAALVVGGLLMLILEQLWQRRQRKVELGEIRPLDALSVGIWQCLALWPGFSRSASTIMGGWFSGLKTSLAAEFSFFVAIPVMFGASGLKLAKFNFSGIELYKVVALVTGFLIAFVTALLVVRAFMNFLRKKPLKVFAYYRFALAGVLLILMLSGILH